MSAASGKDDWKLNPKVLVLHNLNTGNDCTLNTQHCRFFVRNKELIRYT